MSIFHSDDVKRFDEILSALRDIRNIKKELQHMSTMLDKLTQDVADENTAVASLIQLLNNISAQLQAAGTDPAKLKALDDTINSEKAAIIQAITANTPQTPTISSLLPTNGPVGSAVVINGSGFGLTQSASKVTFNGVDAGLASNWSDTQITTTVPSGATTGDVMVVTTVGGSSARGTTFSVDGTGPIAQSSQAGQSKPDSTPLPNTETEPGSGVATPQKGTQEPNPTNPDSTAVQPNPNPNQDPGVVGTSSPNPSGTPTGNVTTTGSVQDPNQVSK